MALSGCDSAMDRYLRHTGTPGQLLDVDKQDKVAQVTPVIRAGGGLEMKNLKSRPAFLLGALLMLVIAVTCTFGQESPEVPPTKEDLAKNNKLFIELASKACEYEREYEENSLLHL